MFESVTLNKCLSNILTQSTLLKQVFILRNNLFKKKKKRETLTLSVF